MEQVIIKKVLEDILEEQQNTNADKKELVESLAQLTQQVKGFDQKLQTTRLVVPAIDTTTMEEVLKTHLQTVRIHLDIHFKKVEKLEKKKAIKEEILYWIAWSLVVALCAIIFRIAIGGSFHGTIF